MRMRARRRSLRRRLARPQVHAHALLPGHFGRYRKTQGWNRTINGRQFPGHGAAMEWPVDYRYPDVTFERARMLKVGELTFELRHAPGEIDDHVWAWLPERGWIFPADPFIWAVPKAGNPQKVQRYCGEWSAALRELAVRSRARQARERVALAGGVARVLDRVAELEADVDLRMACHLVELACLAEPGVEAAHDARARVYAARGAGQVATMPRGIFNHTAASSRERRRDRLSQA
jgi:hypothetical protein